MEGRAADVKVLWSNLYRGVRSLFVTYVKPKESFFAYKFLASMSKYRKELKDVDDVRSKMLIKIKAGRKISDSEAAYSLIPLSINLISKAVSRNPSYGVLTVVARGFKEPRLIAATLTVSKDVYSDSIRPVGIFLNPDAPDTVIKQRSQHVLERLWWQVRDELVGVGIRYVDFEYVDFLPPLAVVTLMPRAVGVEEIKAVVSDGGEYREVKIPVRVPEWRLEDLPPKIVEDIRISIVDPVRKGLPFATKGAFLTGPPGVGKSVMAEALAAALGLKVVELRPQNYRSMWYGATEKMLNAIFKQIIKRRRHLALIIDDAEFISSRKYTMHEAHISEISTILYHLQRPDRPFTVLTANNPDLIDPAILRPGRIDVTVVLGYPDKAMRRKALLRNAGRYGIAFKSEGIVDDIVAVTKWYTLAEVDAFLRLAAGKGGGKVGKEEIEWARKKFNINQTERASMQDYLRWWARKTQGIVITYIPSENEI